MKETKYWIQINDFVEYWDGYQELSLNPENVFMTRKEWLGVHYVNRHGEYCILLRSGNIIVNPPEVYKTDESDWILVDISEEAKDLIKSHSLGIC